MLQQYALTKGNNIAKPDFFIWTNGTESWNSTLILIATIWIKAFTVLVGHLNEIDLVSSSIACAHIKKIQPGLIL